MRLATRSGLITTSLAIVAIAAPNASAGSGVQRSIPGQYGGPMSSGPLVVVRHDTPSSGFDYGDAAVGAGVMAGVTLLGAAGTLTIRRRSQVRHPSAAWTRAHDAEHNLDLSRPQS